MAAQVMGMLLCFLLIFGAEKVLLLPEDEIADDYIRKIQEAVNKSGLPLDQVLYEEAEESNGIQFLCDPAELPKTHATNVHELKPSDIKIVAALGDSITAAFAAKANNIFRILTEYRGVSWSIGGDGDLGSTTTLPNIIKKYNSNIKGYSIRTGNHNSANSHLNRAVSGATAIDIPGQATKLVEMIQKDESVTDDDWKLVTVWIGGNDLCRVCNNKTEQYPENYAQYIKEGLLILKKKLPRTFVNLVKILDVTMLKAVKDAGGLFSLCPFIPPIVCKCGVTNKHIDVTREAYIQYNLNLEMMVESEDLHDSDDFTVVLQPFMEYVYPPRNEKNRIDMSYFALDCFHFREKGHRLGAVSLWNNMFEPVGNKSTKWELDPTLKCPTADSPYIFTTKNSPPSFQVEAFQPYSSHDQGSSLNLLQMFLGVGFGALIALVVAISVLILGVVWYRRHKQRRSLTPETVRCDAEKVYLLAKKLMLLL